MKKAVCVFSGGMDSTTLLYYLLDNEFAVLAVSFDYGQRHKKELGYAARTCANLKVPHKVIDISSAGQVLGGSALTDTDIEVPEGHYEAESMKATVVPNRNMILLAIAGGYAVSEKADVLAIAVHAGDHAIYPDCRPEFIKDFELALRAGNYHQVSVYAPFINWSKAEIAAEGRRLGVDFSATWSCYVGGDEPCGKCGTCVERLEALGGRADS
jgi:7-cyano-7-deazaguanine synthase